jgi:hypothetical protein
MSRTISQLLGKFTSSLLLESDSVEEPHDAHRAAATRVNFPNSCEIVLLIGKPRK